MQNLFCDRTYALTRDREAFVWRRVGKLRAKGPTEVLDVYEAHEPGWIGRYEEALALYEARQFDRAAEVFDAADAERSGGDVPSRRLAATCRERARVGVPEDWQPIAEPAKHKKVSGTT